MADRINVDFINRKKLSTEPLPNADQILFDQACAKLSQSQTFLHQREAAGFPLNADKLDAATTKIATELSDYQIIHGLQASDQHAWESTPEWFAALAVEFYNRSSLTERVA